MNISKLLYFYIFKITEAYPFQAVGRNKRISASYYGIRKIAFSSNNSRQTFLNHKLKTSGFVVNPNNFNLNGRFE